MNSNSLSDQPLMSQIEMMLTLRGGVTVDLQGKMDFERAQVDEMRGLAHQFQDKAKEEEFDCFADSQVERERALMFHPLTKRTKS